MKPAGPVHVLLVEDNPGDAALLEDMLARDVDFHVRHVSSLAEGIQGVQSIPTDLVLLDLSLPDTSGLATVDTMLAAARRIPLIILTGLDDEDLGLEAVRRGAQDYLVKGKVTSELIARSIHYSIERKQSQQALQEAHDSLERKVAERTADLSQALDVLQSEVIQRMDAEENLQRLNQVLQMVIACDEAMVRIRDEGELLQDVCRVIADVGGYRMAWVGFAENDARKSVRPAAAAGCEEGYLSQIRITWADDELGRGPTGTSIRTCQPCIAEDFLTDPRLRPWHKQAIERGYRSSVALPLIVDGSAIGALTIYAAAPHAFDTQKVAVLRQLANDLAFGIRSARAAADHRRLEREVLESAQREQHRIGRDLHDSIQGSLAGIKMLLGSMAGNLRKETPSRAALAGQADNLVEMLSQTLHATQGLARGLCPTDLKGEGLLRAMELLAGGVKDLFGIECEFSCDLPRMIEDQAVATQIYYIAQEALNNAIKHARCRQVSIGLHANDGHLLLEVKDDGVGLPPAEKLVGGLGLRSMKYRAQIIDATLEVLPAEPRGTRVQCRVPVGK